MVSASAHSWRMRGLGEVEAAWANASAASSQRSRRKLRMPRKSQVVPRSRGGRAGGSSTKARTRWNPRSTSALCASHWIAGAIADSVIATASAWRGDARSACATTQATSSETATPVAAKSSQSRKSPCAGWRKGTTARNGSASSSRNAPSRAASLGARPASAIARAGRRITSGERNTSRFARSTGRAPEKAALTTLPESSEARGSKWSASQRRTTATMRGTITTSPASGIASAARFAGRRSSSRPCARHQTTHA